MNETVKGKKDGMTCILFKQSQSNKPNTEDMNSNGF